MEQGFVCIFSDGDSRIASVKLWREECGKEEVTSVHFEAKNVTEEDKEFVEKALAFFERLYNIPDKNLRNKLMENAEKNFEGSMELIELMNGKVSW